MTRFALGSLCVLLLGSVLTCASCAPARQAHSRAEATSLLGQPLARPSIAAPQRERLEADLAAAQAAFDNDPSEDNTVWLGRRLAYLGRFNNAVVVFSRGLERFPDSAKLLRHRGHRSITLRQFDNAIADLSRASQLTSGKPDEIEPDGAPNARNIPRSTLKSNIAYHLALAHYLKGDFAASAKAWSDRLALFRDNDDQVVSATYWLYLSRKRAGDHAGAAAALRDIRLGMDVIENHSYYRLCLCYKGDLRAEEVGEGADGPSNSAIAYGLAVRKLLMGDTAGARADFEAIVGANNWPAFGSIAAEADLARMQGR